jgi:hypothetical protein
MFACTLVSIVAGGVILKVAPEANRAPAAAEGAGESADAKVEL